MVPVREPSKINRPYRGTHDYIQCPVQVPGYGNGFYKITSGTAGNEPNHCLRSNGRILSHKTIYNLIKCSIPSYTNNRLSTFDKSQPG